ncbi:ketopantoate reductase family protein [Mangrovicoccus algicola]|uniref:2-dehydropantoate 2-reductase n=1 Tax=Mangrovicoccus algicola TaxID=2771008 RepID=A0A8J6ZCZ2_9RHOB|nr:2-dehydropantoate 2-reductase N-terminal domain-containing protein [Mangrovicoccus algicola]MBE3639935.1 ketopantoate reductase family protein [Mangrovicoccus algicola]
MEIGIIGAGNVGTAMAALLGAHGARVTVTARGARLARIRAEGVHLDDRGTPHHAAIAALPRLDAPQDAVFLCVKAQDLPEAVAANAAGIGPGTLVVPMVNGLPFWFDPASAELGAVLDPGGLLRARLDPAQVLGAVLLMTIRRDAAGRATSTNTPTLSLAPVAGDTDPGRGAGLMAVLNAAGIRASAPDDIREAVLVKLLANIATNPLSALTGCSLAQIGRDPGLRAAAFAVAGEFRAWAAAAGYALPSDRWLGDLLLDAGDFPTSMLQDARAGRVLELGAICRAPMGLARGAGLAMPCLAAILARLEAAPALPLPEAARAAALAGLPLPLAERT